MYSLKENDSTEENSEVGSIEDQQEKSSSSSELEDTSTSTSDGSILRKLQKSKSRISPIHKIQERLRVPIDYQLDRIDTRTTGNDYTVDLPALDVVEYDFNSFSRKMKEQEQNYEQERNVLQRERDFAKDKLQTLEETSDAELRKLHQTVLRLRGKMKVSERKREELDEEIQSFNKISKNKKDEIIQLENHYRAKLDKVSKQRDKAVENEAKAEKEIELNRKEMHEMSQKLEQYKHSHSTQKDQIIGLENELKNQYELYEDKISKLNELNHKEKIDHKCKLDELEHKLTLKENEILDRDSSGEKQIDNLRDEIVQLRAELTEANKKYNTLLNKQRNSPSHQIPIYQPSSSSNFMAQSQQIEELNEEIRRLLKINAKLELSAKDHSNTVSSFSDVKNEVIRNKKEIATLKHQLVQKQAKLDNFTDLLEETRKRESDLKQENRILYNSQASRDEEWQQNLTEMKNRTVQLEMEMMAKNRRFTSQYTSLHDKSKQYARLIKKLRHRLNVKTEQLERCAARKMALESERRENLFERRRSLNEKLNDDLSDDFDDNVAAQRLSFDRQAACIGARVQDLQKQQKDAVRNMDSL